MSIKRWDAKRDSTDAAIVQALTQAGAQILRGDAVDLLVLYHSRLYLLECKVTAKSRLTPTQHRLIKAGWPIVCVVDPLEALTAIGAIT